MITAVILVADHFVGGQTENKCVLLAHFLHNLHVRTVHRADGQRAVQHKLHVSCAGCLLAGRGNLLGHIRRRKDKLRVGHTVVLDKHYFDLSVDGRIIVHHIRHGIDQLDGKFRILIACCRLRAEDESPGIEIHIRVLFQLIVEIHHMKDVQKLTLILVQTFYLYIKDGTGIYLDTVVLHDVLSQTHFVLVLDIHKLLLRLLVVRINL